MKTSVIVSQTKIFMSTGCAQHSVDTLSFTGQTVKIEEKTRQKTVIELIKPKEYLA